MKREVDWDGVLNAGDYKVGSVVGGAAVPQPKEADEHDSAKIQEEREPEFLTIGLIGDVTLCDVRFIANVTFRSTKRR